MDSHTAQSAEHIWIKMPPAAAVPVTEAHNTTWQCGWSSPDNRTEPLDSTRYLFQSLVPGPTAPALISVFVLLTLFSFVVNLLILSSIGRSDDLSWQPRFTFCKNLILSDLIQTANFGPAVIYSLARRRTVAFSSWCYVQYFVGGVGIFSSLVTITCMALERYLYVCYSIHYLVILTQRRLRQALVVIWVYSFSISGIVTGLLFLREDGQAGDAAMLGFLCEPDTVEQHLGFPRASSAVRKVCGSLTLLLCLLVHAFSYFRMYQDARNAVIPFNAVNVTARKTVMFYCGMLVLQLLPVLLKVTADAARELQGAGMTEQSPRSPGPCGMVQTPTGAAAALHVSLLLLLLVPPCINPLVYGVRNVEMRRALTNLFPWWTRELAGAHHGRAQPVDGVIPGNMLYEQVQAG